MQGNIFRALLVGIGLTTLVATMVAVCSIL